MDATKIETVAMKRAKEEIIAHLIAWLETAEKAGQSPAPVSFGSLVTEDLTMRDLVELARGRAAEEKPPSPTCKGFNEACSCNGG